MSKVINITVTEKEYEILSERAGDITVNQYIKNILFPENDFNQWFPKLVSRVEQLPSNTKFNIKLVMGTDWILIPKGIRLALGRVFFQKVNSKSILNVKILGADTNKTQWYEKINTLSEKEAEING